MAQAGFHDGQIYVRRRASERARRNFVSQPRQAAFIACPADDVGFGGARGGGKSDGVIGFALRMNSLMGTSLRWRSAARRHQRAVLLVMQFLPVRAEAPIGGEVDRTSFEVDHIHRSERRTDHATRGLERDRPQPRVDRAVVNLARRLRAFRE